MGVVSFFTAFHTDYQFMLPLLVISLTLGIQLTASVISSCIEVSFVSTAFLKSFSASSIGMMALSTSSKCSTEIAARLLILCDSFVYHCQLTI